MCEGCSKGIEYDGSFQIKHHEWARKDSYGIFTGIYCDECYDGDEYPYRKDRYYDESYCGERMNNDY